MGTDHGTKIWQMETFPLKHGQSWVPRASPFSALCLGGRLGWSGGVPRTVLGIQAEQRQAWNRHYSCLPQSLYKILPEKRERKGPSLSLLLRQGNGRRGKLPFSSLRQEGSQGLCRCPVPCSQKLEEGEGAALPQFKVKVTCTTSWYLLVLQPEGR